MTNIVPMRHPPGCTCGCQNWGCDSPGWGQDLMQCWDQINQLKCIIKQIMAEVGGPIRTGPIRGVVDGSDARPGDVGEYFSASVTLAYAAGVNTQTTLSPTVVQPGDWDLWSTMEFSTITGYVQFQLSPQPVGMSHDLRGQTGQFVTETGEGQANTVIGRTGRGSFSVPTLLPFSVQIDQGIGAGQPAGTAYLVVEGRRRR